MRQKAARIAVTGGGTGGHISPAVAVIETLRERVPADELALLYLGSYRGPEATIAPQHGVRYVPISTGKLRRYLSLENVADLFRLPLGLVQSLVALRRFRPDALLATGGYVSVPPVLAARLLGVPALVHEQTGALGLANRINARFATKLALSVPGSERGLRRAWVMTGNPVRGVVRRGDRATAVRRYRFDAAVPTIYITGGAQGARAINRAVGAALEGLLRVAQVIHQCGDSAGTRTDYEELARSAAALDPALARRYALVAYVGPEIGEVYALASLVMGRAGAGTVNELATLGKPALLIPLPRAAGDEQRRNARRMADAGAAVVIEETELTPERLVSEVCGLLADPARLAAMGDAARPLGAADAAERITDELLALARRAGPRHE